MNASSARFGARWSLVRISAISLGLLCATELRADLGCMNIGVSPNVSIGEAFKTHEPWRLRLSYVYAYSDADHFYLGETREAGIESTVAPTTLQNSHTLIGELEIPWKATLVVEAPMMYLRQSRETGGAQGTMTAVGLGDMRFVARRWITEENPAFRFWIGLGFRAPTGESNEKFTSETGNRITRDVAAQAGTGNFAGILEAGGSSEINEHLGLFYSARYIFTPEQHTDANNFRWELSGALPPKNSDSDAGNLRVGATVPIGREIRTLFDEEPLPALDGLAAIFAVQAAWIPWDDLIGDSGGFRRAGIIVFAEPGLVWSPRPDVTLSFTAPLTTYRKIQLRGGNVPEWVAQFSVTFSFH